MTRFGRWLSLLGCLCAMILAIPVEAEAQALAPVQVSGSAQFFYFGGLPMPVLRVAGPVGVGLAKAPDLAHPFSGGFQALPTNILRTTGPGPQALVFTRGIFTRPAVPGTLGLIQTRPQLWQVRTTVELPPNTTLPTFSFAAGGRSGAPTVTICPGTLSPPGLGPGQNPGCIGTGGAIAGLIRYQALANQFGGVHRFSLTGSGTVAAFAGSAYSPPLSACNTPVPAPAFCVAALVPLGPFRGPGVRGGPFGIYQTTTVFPLPDNLLNVNATSGGLIVSGIVVGSVPLTNDGTTWGGPWTTGRVFVSAPNAFAGPTAFTITGGDARDANGHGSISMVSGGLARRIQTGDEANRSHLTLVVPAPGAMTSAVVALTALLGLHVGSRRSRHC